MLPILKDISNFQYESSKTGPPTHHSPWRLIENSLLSLYFMSWAYFLSLEVLSRLSVGRLHTFQFMNFEKWSNETIHQDTNLIFVKRFEQFYLLKNTLKNKEIWGVQGIVFWLHCTSLVYSFFYKRIFCAIYVQNISQIRFLMKECTNYIPNYDSLLSLTTFYFSSNIFGLNEHKNYFSLWCLKWRQIIHNFLETN